MTKDEKLKLLQTDLNAPREQVEKLEGFFSSEALRPYQPEWVKPDGE